MRRLARHLLTLSSAGSLLLCFAVLVLWGRSYGDLDHFYRAPAFSFEFDRGMFSSAGDLQGTSPIAAFASATRTSAVARRTK